MIDDEWEAPEGLPAPRYLGDGRGAWRPSDEGPPDVDRPDDYERAAPRSTDQWMTAAGWVRHPDDGRWVRPEALPCPPT